MVTRKQIREFRFWKKELQALRAMIRQAELDARTGGGRSGDERRARERAARYERMAEAVAKEQARIEAEISALHNSRQRHVLYCRYILGWSRVKTACDMGVSESMVSKIIAAGIAELERGSEDAHSRAGDGEG